MFGFVLLTLLLQSKFRSLNWKMFEVSALGCKLQACTSESNHKISGIVYFVHLICSFFCCRGQSQCIFVQDDEIQRPKSSSLKRSVSRRSSSSSRLSLLSKKVCMEEQEKQIWKTHLICKELTIKCMYKKLFYN